MDPLRLVPFRLKTKFKMIDIVKMDINKGVGADKFALAQPEGTTLQVVGETPTAAPTPVPPATKGRVKKK